MLTTKQAYIEPSMEIISLRIQEGILQGSPYGGANSAGTDMTENPDNTYSY